MIDTRLPMMIQQPNVLAALDAGTQAAGNQNALMRQAEGQNLFRQFGADAMSGDQNALRAIGGFDPMMGQQMQAGQLDMQATRQGMSINAERLQMARDETARALASAADQAEALREAQEVERRGRAAIAAFSRGDTETFMAETAGIFGEPLPPTEDGLAGLAAVYEGAGIYAKSRPQGMATPDWRPATAEEAALYGATAGQINDKTGQFQRTPVDTTMTLETLPDGTTRLRQGPAVENAGRIEPSSTGYMINSIDGILNDPALDFATGWRAWTQNIPGTEARRFGARARQLEGQAFLQAFESLKGAGQITEIEGIKATQAIGRLDTAQRPEDYRAALTELRDILIEAQGRPQGWAETQGADPAAALQGQAAPAPEGLSAQDAELWPYFTEEERAAIMREYQR